MRIIAGANKGKILIAPAGANTRPTADRARQALFDMIMHASWGGRDLIEGAAVLDAFAGTGALGLEALSRGGGFCHFIEQDKAALAALRANIATCKRGDVRVWDANALTPPKGTACALVFLDPPYHRNLVQAAVPKLTASGWIAPGSIVVAETARDEAAPTGQGLLADRTHGAARIWVWQA